MQKADESMIQAMTQRLVDRFQPEQVILFGSHAWGAPGGSSDVDLLVIVPSSGISGYERSVQAHACLSEFDVPKDVIVKTRAEFFRDVRASLEHKVLKQGKVLYERGQAKPAFRLG